MKNVLEYDIQTSTTEKGYMHSFQGFANVVKKINLKLKKDKSDLDSWAVDIDYNSTIPIIDQINNKVIDAINRIQSPVLNLMHVYGIQALDSKQGFVFCFESNACIPYT